MHINGRNFNLSTGAQAGHLDHLISWGRVHGRENTYTSTYIFPDKHVLLHTYIDTHIFFNAPTCTYIHIYISRYTYFCTHNTSLSHTYTHTHTYSQIRTYFPLELVLHALWLSPGTSVSFFTWSWPRSPSPRLFLPPNSKYTLQSGSTWKRSTGGKW